MSNPVEIHIAYGTEKQKWLEEATAEFQKTPEGRRITVKLHGMGSVEGAQAVLEGPNPIPIHVWSPASSAYRDLFEQEWRAKHKNNPILKSENLALTPMVFVTWDSRHAPFITKYGKANFQTVGQAMREPRGWEAIAGQPGWGRFKFGHTHPNRSNSGLLTLVLMAYEFSKSEVPDERADATPCPRARLPAGEFRGLTPVRRESLDPLCPARDPDRIAPDVRTTPGRCRQEPACLLRPPRIGCPTPAAQVTKDN